MLDIRNRVKAVLVVETDEFVRAWTAEVFQDLQCEVIEADCAEAALAALDAHPEIGLMFSDVAVPGPMDGVALARTLKRERPDLMVVLTSGHRFVGPHEFCLLPKPWAQRDIEDLVVEVAALH